jgi:hypothetical protein
MAAGAQYAARDERPVSVPLVDDDAILKQAVEPATCTPPAEYAFRSSVDWRPGIADILVGGV